MFNSLEEILRHLHNILKNIALQNFSRLHAKEGSSTCKEKHAQTVEIFNVATALLKYVDNDEALVESWDEVFKFWWTQAQMCSEPELVIYLVRDLCILLRSFDHHDKHCAVIEQACEELQLPLPEKDNSADFAKRLSYLPINQWSYQWESNDVVHIGPMAQTFHAMFRKKGDPTTIPLVDVTGLTLNLLQHLSQKCDELQAKVCRLEQELEKK